MHIGPECGGPLNFWSLPAATTTWTSATATCTQSVGSLRLIACQLRHWKQMPPMEGTLPWNLLFHSPFRQVDLVMNDALVPMSGDTYPYRAYLMMKISAWWLTGWWSPTVSSLTSRVGSTRTCCCKSNWCPTTWISGWSCCMLVCVPPHRILVASRKLTYASRRPSWRYARSRSLPLNSCAWRRSWPLRGPNTR